MVHDPPLGVLLVNVGSPQAPTAPAVRRYLREFLGDPDVVKLNRVVWWLLLNGVILPIRSPKSAALYRSVWTENGSPLIHNSRLQANALQASLGERYAVALAMRYGEPSLDKALDDLERRGCRQLLLAPLFPQYSGTTSGTVEKAVRAALARRRSTLSLSVLPAFPEDPGYLDAVAQRVRESTAGVRVDHYVFSFHGLPERYVRDDGDPYRGHCVATAKALARALGLAEGEWSLVFQSRFGREPWLQPYAAEAVPQLARKHRSIAVACPGFTADCLETLEEIHIGLGRDFRAAGGDIWTVAPCLNDHPRWIAALAELVRRAAPLAPPQSCAPRLA
jgi:ferrochelatase